MDGKNAKLSYRFDHIFGTRTFSISFHHSVTKRNSCQVGFNISLSCFNKKRLSWKCFDKLLYGHLNRLHSAQQFSIQKYTSFHEISSLLDTVRQQQMLMCSTISKMSNIPDKVRLCSNAHRHCVFYNSLLDHFIALKNNK